MKYIKKIFVFKKMYLMLNHNYLYIGSVLQYITRGTTTESRQLQQQYPPVECWRERWDTRG